MRYIFRLLSFIAVLYVDTLCLAQAKSPETHSAQLIVLLHGFANNAASFGIMQKKLEHAFPAATVIALTSVEGKLSATLPIKAQAEAIFEEMSTKLAHLDQKSIILIGHSQGGARAYAFLQQYKSLLNIKGVVALATPWEGVPGARVDMNMLTQYLTDPVLDDLRRLSLGCGYPSDMFVQQLRIAIQQNQYNRLFPGAQDLMINSSFLAEVHKALLHEEVPILFIGGIQSGFASLLPKKIRQAKHAFDALNTMHTFFIVGENRLRQNGHDMQIPLYSQLALNIVPKHKKNFKRMVVKEVFHGTHIWPKLRVPSGKSMLAHPDVVRKVIAFTKKALAQK